MQSAAPEAIFADVVIIEQFTIKAYVMDNERIKAGGSVLNRSIENTDRDVLQDTGKVTAGIAKLPPKANSKNTASSRIGC